MKSDRENIRQSESAQGGQGGCQETFSNTKETEGISGKNNNFMYSLDFGVACEKMYSGCFGHLHYTKKHCTHGKAWWWQGHSLRLLF